MKVRISPTRWVLFASILCLGAVALNGILYYQVRRLYTDLQAVRLDPFSRQKFQTPEALVPGKVRLVFFGDSRAKAWTIPPQPGLQVINRGLSAHSTWQNLNRYAAHVSPLQPDILVIQMGMNDLKSIPLFPGAERAIIDSCKAHLSQIVARARAEGSQVILTTIFPHARVPLYRRPVWSPKIAAAIAEVNAYLHTLAGPQVLVMDTAPALTGGSAYVERRYALDLLHLKPAGYEALNRDLLPLIQDLLASPPALAPQ